MGEQVLLVSIDGLAPGSIDAVRAPNLCRLARAGAGCFAARTVEPPLTLPAHASMLRGVAPSVHGSTSNDPSDFVGVAPSILRVARDADLATAAVFTWTPFDRMIEPGAVRHRVMVEGGDDEGDDDLIVERARVVLKDEPDLSFVYLCGPDLVGHDDGWGSEPYDAAVRRADERLGRLVDAVGADTAIVVTTDHAGVGRSHATADDETMTTFVAARSARIPAMSCWPTASILDIAPTVADLLDLPADDAWEGRSLIGRSQPVVDWLVAGVEAMADHTYGERLDMMSHSLQTAAKARAEGADDELVVAALLHDIGHTLGTATRWGRPDHDAAGANAIQAWFDQRVTEPIRLHVAAKRHLVAVDPSYVDELSTASVESLRQQGGPFTEAECDVFMGLRGADDALALRRWDDDGKVTGLDVAPVERYRPVIERVLADATPVGARWARDSCQCAECRDPGSGQRLLGPEDLAGWSVVGQSHTDAGRVVVLERATGERHDCVIGAAIEPTPERAGWGASHGGRLRERAIGASGPLDRFVADLSADGIALVTGVDPTPGEILRFAGRVGFVRDTNYGELFDVVSEPDPINLAYTPKGLSLHTDNPYRDPVPTVQLLHCLHAAEEGGASLFCDGFAAAAALRLAAPADFDVLASTLVSFRFVSDDTDLRAELPLITLDAEGRVTRVAVNSRSMEPLGAGARADRFYDAYGRFTAELADPAHVIELTLGVGELVAFDNRRVLHGRSGFATDPDRHLQGCYLDIDAVHSAVRVAERNGASHAR